MSPSEHPHERGPGCPVGREGVPGSWEPRDPLETRLRSAKRCASLAAAGVLRVAGAITVLAVAYVAIRLLLLALGLVQAFLRLLGI